MLFEDILLWSTVLIDTLLSLNLDERPTIFGTRLYLLVFIIYPTTATKQIISMHIVKFIKLLL